MCGAGPGGTEVELHNCELSSPAWNIHDDVHVCCDERGDKQAVTIVTSHLPCDVV